MKNCRHKAHAIACSLGLLLSSLEAYDASPSRIKLLYTALSPLSLSQHLALYELYPHTVEGMKALSEGWSLIAGDDSSAMVLPSYQVAQAMVALVNKQPNSSFPELSDEQLAQIERLASKLSNRKLPGFQATCESEVLSLDPSQIDLARALFLAQFGHSPSALRNVRCHEAMVDLMALQIRAKFPKNATAAQKIETINHFIFCEQGFRFPPQSVYAKGIDLYTFLPSVLDCRQGVCLGISLLYLSLAQRLDLPLEIITPPGHIYVRHGGGSPDEINIETTARGVHLDSTTYLSIDTFMLKERSIKEAVGMAHFNQASLYLQTNDFSKALEAYEKALTYMPEDRQIHELMGFCLILTGNIEQGKFFLQRSFTLAGDGSIPCGRAAEDYLNGLVGDDGFKALFMPVDDTRSSIIAKQQALQRVVAKYPHFRDGLFALATTWLQLHRMNEAITLLQRYHHMDSKDPKVEYYLALLHMERFNYPSSWKHLHNAENIVFTHTPTSKILTDLKNALSEKSPRL
jgi:tetratricopeptide (TPR) repeat protein